MIPLKRGTMKSYGPARWLVYYETQVIICARYYTSCCLAHLIICFQMHFIARFQAHSQARSQLRSQDALKYTLKYAELYCIYKSQPEMSIVCPETEMSCMAGDGDVLYGRRRRCLVWPETEMSRMAGDDCWLWYELMAFSRTCTFIYILALWPS